MERGRLLLVMVASIVLMVSPVVCDETAKPVSTVLRASWPDTPLLLEARCVYKALHLLSNHHHNHHLRVCSEFMSVYKQSLFWEFVNITKSLRPGLASLKGEKLLFPEAGG